MVDKSSIFGGMITTQGAAKKTNCDALGIPWEPRYMLIGDANGADPVPNPSQTKLVNQVHRAQINQLRVSPTDANVLIAEVVLPPDVGGWWVRELALEDKDGVFSAVANAPPSYKPVLAQGSGRNQVVRMHIITSGTSNIQLKIDPSVVLATRQYVDEAVNGLLPANKPAGTYTKVTVNDRGVFVSGSNPTTLAGFGIKDAYTKLEIESMIAQASALPVGSMIGFPVNKVAPGFLELDGSVKSVATYPDLATFLGGAFNKGDEGAGNFRLPESRGEFLRGWDHGRGVDAGRTVGSYQADEIKKHRHPQYEYDTNDATPIPDLSRAFDLNAAYSVGREVTALIGYTGGSETRPRNISVVWCIKAWNAPINQGNIDVAALAAQIAAFVPRDYQAGMIMSMSVAAPTTTVDFSAGSARGVGNGVVASSAMSCVLQSVGAWSPGSGGNKIDTGIRTAGTWYHAYVIRKNGGGERDMLFSTGAAPQVPGGYELIARLKGRSVKMDASGNIIPFINTGNSTDFKVMPQEMFVAGVNTNSYTLTVSVPPVARIRARFYARTMGESSVIYVRSPEAAAVTLVTTAADGFSGGIGTSNDSQSNENVSGYCEALTNQSGQVVVQVLGYPGYSVIRASLHTQGWTEE